MTGFEAQLDAMEQQLAAMREELLSEQAKVVQLTSMCQAAADEILAHWAAHCDEFGYGPTALVSRLEGRLMPDLYVGALNQIYKRYGIRLKLEAIDGSD